MRARTGFKLKPFFCYSSYSSIIVRMISAMKDVAMDGWRSFFFVIIGQLAVFVLAGILYKRRLSNMYRYLLVGFVIGLPVGLFFDMVAGIKTLVFTYSTEKIGPLFFALNAIFSYGIATSTALATSIQLKQFHSFIPRMISYIVLLLLFVLFSGITGLYQIDNKLLQMVGIGSAVIVIGECVAIICGHEGIIVSAINGSPSEVIHLWIFSICVGTLYEMLNYISPLWHWIEISNVTYIQTEALIIVFGYFVLFHPMIVLSKILLNMLDSQ